MKDAGAEVELLYLRKMDIKACIGCFTCWFKTPGKCIHDDDISEIFQKFLKADIKVFATPLYVDGMTGMLKNLFDRLIPLAEPFFEMRDGHCRHVHRFEQNKKPKSVLVANCGFWELDNFVPLVEHFKAICRNEDDEFAGALLRPHGPALRFMKDQGDKAEKVIEAAKDAGRQLIKNGKIEEKTLREISQDLLPLDEYFKTVNSFFEQKMKEMKK